MALKTLPEKPYSSAGSSQQTPAIYNMVVHSELEPIGSMKCELRSDGIQAIHLIHGREITRRVQIESL